MTETPSVGETILDAAQGAGPEALLVIGGVAVVAFSIKAAWVAWRAGSKAVSKTGS